MMRIISSRAQRGTDAAAAAEAGNLSSSSLSSSFIGSGVMVMPCLILMLAVGLCCKVLETVLLRDALDREEMLQFSNATTADSKKRLFGIEDYYKNDSADENTINVTVLINILFPILGMLVLKSMRKADNVRETIELAVPVCGVNSLCIVCIILIQAPACMLHHLAMDTQAQPPGTVTVKHPLPVLNASGIIPLPYEHAQAPILEHEFVIARYQPILAALALPFPLVCSIVCIVAAVRNRRVMVSSFFMHTQMMIKHA
jgi:hypothetical protein